MNNIPPSRDELPPNIDQTIAQIEYGMSETSVFKCRKCGGHTDKWGIIYSIDNKTGRCNGGFCCDQCMMGLKNDTRLRLPEKPPAPKLMIIQSTSGESV